MGRRTRRKQKITLPGDEKVHDRKATDLLRNAQVAPLDVDDPYEPGAKIAVMRSTRRDPLAWMHAHGQIDEAQYRGGRAWQHDWETAERGPVAIDPSKEFVDGGRLAEGITESMRRSVMRLKGVAATLVADDRKILQASLVEGLTAEQIALVHFGRYGKRWTEKFGIRVRGILDTLAAFYGYAMNTPYPQGVVDKGGVQVVGG